MYRVELYGAVRRSVYVEGLSERAAALRVGPRDGAQDAALPVLPHRWRHELATACP